MDYKIDPTNVVTAAGNEYLIVEFTASDNKRYVLWLTTAELTPYMLHSSAADLLKHDSEEWSGVIADVVAIVRHDDILSRARAAAALAAKKDAEDERIYQDDMRIAGAAKDLLAALRRSLNWLSSYPGGGALGAYDEARAAIAKATEPT